MNSSFNKTEKLLLTTIVAVLIAIIATGYFGFQMIQNTVRMQTELSVEADSDFTQKDTKEKVQVSEDLTQDEKLQILKSLKTGSGTLTKQNKLETMQTLEENSQNTAPLSMQQKMDILSGL